jgi:UDP-N-acetylmuramyl pentapeptide phosphotransferase/UDP-N-acetylglucosamine-1-phosphate transferase
MREKVLIVAVCLLGILGVCYGMVNKDHPVFIAGLVAVVAGYLMFRKKLKAHIKENYPSEEARKNKR